MAASISQPGTFASMGLEKTRYYFNSGRPAVSVASTEEARVVSGLMKLAEEEEADLVLVSATEGATDIKSGTRISERFNDAIEAIDFAIDRAGSDTWFVFLDFHELVKDPIVKRRVRDMLKYLTAGEAKAVFLDSSWSLPPELNNIPTVMMKLPTREQLHEIVTGVRDNLLETIKQAENAGEAVEPYDLDVDEIVMVDLVEAMVGMPAKEAEDALALSFQLHRRFDRNMIEDEKVRFINRDGVLDIWPNNLDIEDTLGGYTAMKDWLRMTAPAFGDDAREYGLPNPKGFVMIGPPGVGKTLTARCLAALLKCPMLKLDVAKLFGSLVGESETRTREVIELCETIGKCVLLIDEIDKGMAMPTGAVASGGEVTKHVVGTIIQWLSEKQSPVFVVATCNDIQSTPPELLRKGRFDEVFFVDLPTQEERSDIARVVVKKVKRDPDSFGLDEIAEATPGFSGAEIEQAVISGMKAAFFDGKREFTTDDIVDAAKETMPLSLVEKDRIEGLRKWAKGRTRFASYQNEEETGKAEVASYKGRRKMSS